MTRDELAGLVRLREACPKGLQSDGRGRVRDVSGRLILESADTYADMLVAADLAALAPGLVDRLVAFYEIVAAVGKAWSETDFSEEDAVEGVPIVVGELAYRLTAGGGMYAVGAATIGGNKEAADAGLDGPTQADEGVVGEGVPAAG